MMYQAQQQGRTLMANRGGISLRSTVGNSSFLRRFDPGPDIEGYASGSGRLPEFVEEVLGQLILSLFQLCLGHTGCDLHRDVQSKLMRTQQVTVKEINDARRVLPRPQAQVTGAINCVGAHVVVEQRVKIVVGHAAHLAPKSAHFQLRLVVHLSDQLLAVLELDAELSLLLAE